MERDMFDFLFFKIVFVPWFNWWTVDAAAIWIVATPVSMKILIDLDRNSKWIMTNNFGSRLRLIVPSILANWTSTSSSSLADTLEGFKDNEETGRNGVGVGSASDELYNYQVLVVGLKRTA